MAFTHNRFVRFNAAQVFVAGFISTILTGTALLALPAAQRHPIPLIDLFFTATSATCVTGLSTIDISTDFTVWGQLIVLLLIQIGGIGIMGYAALFSQLLFKQFQSKTATQLQSIMEIYDVRRFRSVLISIFKFTLLIEVIGTALLMFCEPFRSYPPAKRIYFSFFHAISGFCNAGFSLFTNSLEAITSPWFVLVISILIVLGGLGFWALLDFQSFRIEKPIDSWRKLTLHTKIVLSVTLLLLITGTVLFYVTESQGLLYNFSFGRRLMHAAFLSVTSRTAGFNLVPTGLLSNSTIFLLLIFMFIGASPGSTGGGIKTTTVGLLLFKLRQILMSERDVEAFGRKIADDTIVKAVAILFLSLMVISLAIFVMFLSDHHGFHEIVFETLSAFGTVGLSTGITGDLNSVAKLIICVVMLAGRVGPLTLALSLSFRKKTARYSLPEERVLVG